MRQADFGLRWPTRIAACSAPTRPAKSARCRWSRGLGYVSSGKRAPLYDATLIGRGPGSPTASDSKVLGRLFRICLTISRSPSPQHSGRPAIAASGCQLRRACSRCHRVRAERPRRAVDQPRRHRRAVEDHREFELGLPAVATSRSLRGLSGRAANCIVAGRSGRICSRFERSAPTPSMSTALASAMTSFRRSTGSSRWPPCARPSSGEGMRMNVHSSKVPASPGRTSLEFRSPTSTTKRQSAVAGLLPTVAPQGRVPQPAQRQSRLQPTHNLQRRCRIS